MEFCVPWIEGLDISVKHLNEDHHALLDKLNVLLVTLSWNDSESIMLASNALRHTAQVHFEKEESLMRRANYPDFEKHSASHQELIRGLDELRFKVDTVEHVAALLDLSPYLERWFVPHLTHDDKRLADFVANQSIATFGTRREAPFADPGP